MTTNFQGIMREGALAALVTPYQQHMRLMPMQRFQSYMRDRDCNLDLADLWGLGVLRPVIIDGPVPARVVRKGMVEVRTPIADDHEHFADARPMPKNIRAGVGKSVHEPGDLGRQVWYHPFQVFQAYRVMRQLGQRRQINPRSLEALMKSWEVVDAARLVTLLINVAPLVMPWISGRVISNRTAGESYESFWAWRRSHNPQHLVGEHGFAEAELRRWHDDMARTAYGLDPLSAWFDLTRNVAWDAWERVKGKARLAHELYTMAQIIRLYANEFLHTDLPEEDEVWHGPMSRKVKERDYGHPLVTGRRRDVRRRVARKFGLDGGVRVVWFVEGDTEKAFISRYGELTGFQCDARGIAIKNLKGSGGVKREHLRQRLEEARQEDQFTYVTVDSLPNMSKELRQLAHDGLITAGFRIWRGDFESDNFTDKELAAIVRATAKEADVEVRINAGAISKEREGETATGGAIKRCLRGQPYQLGKGGKWGAKLAEWAVEQRCPEEIAEDGDRPMVALLWSLVRDCSADYLGSVENLRVGDDGKIVER